MRPPSRAPLGVIAVVCLALLIASFAWAGSIWTNEVFVKTGSGCLTPATGKVTIRRHSDQTVLATPAVDRFGNVSAFLEPELVDISYPNGVSETSIWLCTQPSTPTVTATPIVGQTATRTASPTPTLTPAATATKTATPTPTVTATPGCYTILVQNQPVLGDYGSLATTMTGGGAGSGLNSLRQRIDVVSANEICRVDLCIGNAPAGNPTPAPAQALHLELWNDDVVAGCGLTSCPYPYTGDASASVASSLPGIVKDAPFNGTSACETATGYGTLVSFTFATPVNKYRPWLVLVNDTLAAPIRWAQSAGESYGGIGFNGWSGNTNTGRDFLFTVYSVGGSAPVATATPTPTATPTATKTATPTPTVTATATPVPGCLNPTLLAAGGDTDTATTSGPSFDTGTCTTSNNSPENAYQWTPNFTGLAIAYTCGGSTGYDTVIYVRSGSCSTGTELKCDDDSSGCTTNEPHPTHASKVTWNVTSGTTYWIIVDGYNGAAGTYTLTVGVAPTPTPTVTPTPTKTATPTVTVTPTPTATSTPTVIIYDSSATGTTLSQAGTGPSVPTIITGSIVIASAANRGLFVGVGGEDPINGGNGTNNDCVPVTSVTLTNGATQSLTKIGEISNASASINCASLWWLPAPTVGTGTITATYASTNGGMNEYILAAVSLSNVSQSAPSTEASVATQAVDSVSGGAALNLGTTTGHANSWLVGMAMSGQLGSITTAGSGTCSAHTDEVIRVNAGSGGANTAQLAFATRPVASAGAATLCYEQTGVTTNRWAGVTAAVAVYVPVPTPTPTATLTPTPTPTSTPGGCNDSSDVQLAYAPAIGDYWRLYPGAADPAGAANARQRVHNTTARSVCRVKLCLGNNGTNGTGTYDLQIRSDDGATTPGATIYGTSDTHNASDLNGLNTITTDSGSPTGTCGTAGNGNLVTFAFASAASVPASDFYLVLREVTTLAGNTGVFWGSAALETGYPNGCSSSPCATFNAYTDTSNRSDDFYFVIGTP